MLLSATTNAVSSYCFMLEIPLKSNSFLFWNSRSNSSLRRSTTSLNFDVAESTLPRRVSLRSSNMSGISPKCRSISCSDSSVTVKLMSSEIYVMKGSSDPYSIYLNFCSLLGIIHPSKSGKSEYFLYGFDPVSSISS